MKKQNRKQGFTLVELLVVIAILAILATVSIVGYTAFIKKAHQSNANAEANQLKEAIRANLIAGEDFVIGTVETPAVAGTDGAEGTPATSTTYSIGMSNGNVVYKVEVKQGEGAPVVTAVVVKLGTGENPAYSAVAPSGETELPVTTEAEWKYTPTDGTETTIPTDINAALGKNADFQSLLEHGNFTLELDATDGLILVYNYTEYDGGITAKIYLNDLDK